MVIFGGAIHDELYETSGFVTCFAEESHTFAAWVYDEGGTVGKDKVRSAVDVEESGLELERIVLGMV
jgi:hypothetical protein